MQITLSKGKVFFLAMLLISMVFQTALTSAAGLHTARNNSTAMATIRAGATGLSPTLSVSSQLNQRR